MSLTTDLIQTITARARNVRIARTGYVSAEALRAAKTDLDFHRKLMTAKEPDLDQPIRIERILG